MYFLIIIPTYTTYSREKSSIYLQQSSTLQIEKNLVLTGNDHENVLVDVPINAYNVCFGSEREEEEEYESSQANGKRKRKVVYSFFKKFDTDAEDYIERHIRV